MIFPKSRFFFYLLLFSMSVSAQQNKEGVSVILPDNATRGQVIQCATQVRPSYRQIDYQQREMLGFIHIGMNTFTGLEWGTGKESPEIFNPSQLNADEWVKTFKKAGITGVILVAKHHDGFCVWPSKYTDHTVAHSPWRRGKGDLVKEVADACHKYGMKLCLYLSPWDMHDPTYGSEAYNDYYIHLLEELLTNYGPVYLLWFDGAGTEELVNGHKMPFDWHRIFSKARELQPDVLLSGNAPDIRWVGNEMGKGRSTEWCVQGINTMEPLFSSLSGYSYRISNLGSIEDLMTKKRLVWYPSRGGLPLRKGWFYNANDDNTTKSLSYLVDSYFSTIGQNSNLLPNLSPDKTGRFPAKDAQRLIDFGKIIAKMKSVDYAKHCRVIPVSGWIGNTSSSLITDTDPFTSWSTADGTTTAVAEVKLVKPATINVIKIQENIRDFGQRVERFAIDVMSAAGWKEVATGTSIGFRRMVRLSQPVHSDSFRIRFLDARVSISFGNLSMYYLEDIQQEQNLTAVRTSLNGQAITLSFNGIKGNVDSNLLIDGNERTIWKGIVDELPATVVMQLKSPQTLTGISYLPDGTSNNHIDNYAIYTSSDGSNWKLASSGRFGNIENNPVEQFINFTATDVQYVKLEIQKIISSQKRVNINEIKLFVK